MFERMAAGLTGAALGLIKFVIAAGIFVAVAGYALNQPEDFGRVVSSVAEAAGNVIVLFANWIAEKAAENTSPA